MAIGSGLSADIGMVEEVYANEVQSISGTPSGTFGLNFDGALTTVTLTTTATAASIQAALEALPNIGTGGVVCAGGPLPTAVSVTFQGPLVAKRNVPILVVQGAITGLTFGTTTPGTGYGDAVTVTRFLELVNEGVKLNVDRIESAAVRSGNSVLRTDRWVSNRKGAAGDLEFEVADRGFGILLKHMFGGAAITTPTNGVLTRDHTYTVADLFNKSLTVQLGTPDTFGTVRPLTYKGTKIASWELSNSLNQLLMLKVTVDAMDEDQSIGLAAPSFGTQSLLSFVGGQITVAGANFDVTDVSVQGDNGLKTDRYFLRSNTLKKEPVHNSFRAFTGTLTAEFTDLAAYNRYVNGTLASVTATWVGAQIEAVTPTYFYTLQVTMPQVRFDGETPDISGPDILTQSLPFKALWDGTTSPVTVLYRTTDTTE